MLAKLKELENFEPVQTVTNINGWTVFDRAGNEVGTVDSYLIDPEQNRLLYLALNVEGKTRMVPLEQILLDFQNQAVRLNEATRSDLERYPEYEEGSTIAERERDYYVTFAPKE
ncbi:MAG: PRC-barrel domain-containing protein [Bacteroidota bacterium]